MIERIGALVILAILVGIGFVVGKFFALWVLIAVTVAAVCWCVFEMWKFCNNGNLPRYMWYYTQECWAAVGIVCVPMWLTYYIDMNQAWANYLFTWILR